MDAKTLNGQIDDTLRALRVTVKLLTVSEVADVLRVSRMTCYRYVRARQDPRVSRRSRVPDPANRSRAHHSRRGAGMRAGELVTPKICHTCEPPMEVEDELYDVPEFGDTKAIHPGYPPPIGSRWRCPECGVKWRVFDRNKIYLNVSFAGTSRRRWYATSHGFFWRRYRQLVHVWQGIREVFG
jgi:rubredoxin